MMGGGGDMDGYGGGYGAGGGGPGGMPPFPGMPGGPYGQGDKPLFMSPSYFPQQS